VSFAAGRTLEVGGSPFAQDLLGLLGHQFFLPIPVVFLNLVRFHQLHRFLEKPKKSRRICVI